MRVMCLTLACFVWAALHLPATAADKVALVIGNGNYVHANVLPNPSNDATDIAAALQNLGFVVISGTDLSFAAMGEKIGEFEEAARDADVTLFFFAGHGIQVSGRNYLLPIEAKLERESTLNFEAIDTETVLNAMSGAGKTAIALLDACRDNPLSRSFSRSMGTRSTAVGKGLATPAMTGGGILIGFATAPGATAADGEGRNSPFTTAMLQHINTPGLEIQSLMTRVKADVFAATEEEQQPWHNSSLRTEFYMVPGDKPKPVAIAIMPKVQQEWNVVKNTNSIAALEAFIAAHPNKPIFTALAQERKQILERKNTAEFLESLAIPDTVTPQDVNKSDASDDQTFLLPKLEDIVPDQPKSGFDWNLEKFFDLGKTANEGNTIFALLGTSTVKPPHPLRNNGAEIENLTFDTELILPTMQDVLANQTALTFSEEASTSCNVGEIEKCSFLPAKLVAEINSALIEKNLLWGHRNGNMFHISRIAGSEDYILSNSPQFANGTMAILAAIVTAEGQVKEIFGFDLSRDRIEIEAGDAASIVALTWAAKEGDDLFVSFDAAQRCTSTPRQFGFITRFNMSDRSVKWVSAFNVSDKNFLILGDKIIAANGGDCSEDYAYKLSKDTGEIEMRFKLPNAIQRMDSNNQKILLELYKGAAAYNLD